MTAGGTSLLWQNNTRDYQETAKLLNDVKSATKYKKFILKNKYYNFHNYFQVYEARNVCICLRIYNCTY